MPTPPEDWLARYDRQPGVVTLIPSGIYTAVVIDAKLSVVRDRIRNTEVPCYELLLSVNSPAGQVRMSRRVKLPADDDGALNAAKAELSGLGLGQSVELRRRPSPLHGRRVLATIDVFSGTDGRARNGVLFVAAGESAAQPGLLDEATSGLPAIEDHVPEDAGAGEADEEFDVYATGDDESEFIDPPIEKSVVAPPPASRSPSPSAKPGPVGQRAQPMKGRPPQ